MTQEKELIEFDDDDAIKFIIKKLPQDLLPTITDDMVQYVIDLICDYYEQHNLFDESDTVSAAEIAEDDMFNYIAATTRKEQIFDLTDAQLQAILDGEYEYGVSIGIYTDAD
jgi:hypothetical protein